MNARDIRETNVLIFTNAADCEIFLEELDHAAGQIEDDITAEFGDAEWERRARRALVEIEHKGKLTKMKLEALTVGAYPEDVRYAILFREAALRVLTEDEICKIKNDPQLIISRG